MANLLRSNSCNQCQYYESEANDYFFQWCLHPDLEGYLREYLGLRGLQPSPDGAGEAQWRDPEYKETEGFADSDFYVSICPLTGKSPYEGEEEVKEE